MRIFRSPRLSSRPCLPTISGSPSAAHVPAGSRYPSGGVRVGRRDFQGDRGRSWRRIARNCDQPAVSPCAQFPTSPPATSRRCCTRSPIPAAHRAMGPLVWSALRASTSATTRASATSRGSPACGARGSATAMPSWSRPRASRCRGCRFRTCSAGAATSRPSRSPRKSRPWRRCRRRRCSSPTRARRPTTRRSASPGTSTTRAGRPSARSSSPAIAAITAPRSPPPAPVGSPPSTPTSISAGALPAHRLPALLGGHRVRESEADYSSRLARSLEDLIDARARTIAAFIPPSR